MNWRERRRRYYSGGGLLVSGVQYQPWQFTPEAYGAKGDGLVYGDGAISTGTANFSSASAAFTGNDVGKHIMINGGQGATSAPLITTIKSVTDANHVVLNANAGATVTSGSFIYGTDDTAAVNSAVGAASTYAQANRYFAQVIFAAKFYCLASGPTQTGDGSTVPTFNSQIPLPYPAASGVTQKLVLELIGAGDASQPQYFGSTVPDLHGTCLVSMVLAPGSGGSATYGAQSVIGGPTGREGFNPQGWANTQPVIDGITLVCGWGAQQIGFDFRYVPAAGIPNASYQALAAVGGNAPALSTIPTAPGTNSVGLYMPLATNNDDCFAGQFTAECVSYGVAFSEHFNAQRLTCVYCDVGAYVNDPGGVVIHGASILYYSCEASHTTLQCTATGSQFPLFIGLLDTEVIDTNDIDDANSVLTGMITWADFERTTMLVNGAGKLKIVNARLNPGYWSGAPSVPATTVAQQNTAWRDATVYLTSGGAAVSAVTVDGQVTGLTLGSSGTVTVRVPAGKNITLTYASTAPTWKWVLD
jgi:hypothetical protein